MILNYGHDRAVDWWALGILLHEMVLGVAPFADAHDPMAIYTQVARAVLPEPIGRLRLSREARALVEGLLAREPSDRLGCLKGGVEDVRGAAFFSRLNFARLLKKLIQAPYVPKVTGPLDTSLCECDQPTPRNDHVSANHAATAHLFDDF